jgi:hypothetical protein
MFKPLRCVYVSEEHPSDLRGRLHGGVCLQLPRPLGPLLGPPKQKPAILFIVGSGRVPLALAGVLQAIFDGG